MSTPTKSITLFFQEGSSDKEYYAEIVPSGAGYLVNARWGRRGNMAQSGTKTPSPVDLASAEKIYDKLVREKTSKGYQIESGSAGNAPAQSWVRANQQADTGVRPQLLNAIEKDQVQHYIDSDDHCLQEKMDGERVMLHVVDNEAIASNRKGLVVDMPKAIHSDALAIAKTASTHDGNAALLLDGERIGDHYYAFDLLEVGNSDMRDRPYIERFDLLEKIISVANTSNIVLVPAYFGSDAKATKMAEINGRAGEGVVFKHLAAPYSPGRPNSGGTQLKYKFYETASLIAGPMNGDRASVQMFILNDGVKTNVGNATIPPNKQAPKEGDVIEVKYLYAFKGGCLFQPQYLCVRSDIDVSECDESQLKYKPEEPAARASMPIRRRP